MHQRSTGTDFVNTVKAAILGFGRWGRILHDASLSASRLRISHVVTRSPDKVREYCTTHDLVLGDDFEPVLKDDGIDAVIIATPHTQHASQLLQCAHAGKHVYCEKPFTLTGDDAAKALDALESGGCTAAIGHNRRFAPNTLALQDMLAAGELGDPVHIEGVFNASMTAAKGQWRDSVDESPAGGMTSLGIHALDMMINLMGNVREVRATSRRVAASLSFDDCTVADLLFANNASGRLTTLTSTAMQWRITWYGTRGWAELQDLDTLIVQPVEGERKTTHYPGYAYPGLPTITSALQAFAGEIQGGAAFPVTPAQIAHGTATLEAIIRSAETRQAVTPGA